MVRKTVNGTIYEITKAPASSSKKLKATYTNPDSGRQKSILFGQKSYEHFYDKTGLLPKSQNHGDPQRRSNYRSRHRGDNLTGRSAGALSYHLLW